MKDTFDIILITAEYHDDHPLSPAGVICKVLSSKGYKVGIIEKPVKKEDYIRLGEPKLCFCVTSGSIDSMLNNYTPFKKRRDINPMPDRAVIVYCNKIKEYFKESKIVIGGIEASLRRFTHYDYWDNGLRRSILLDSRADILVYGNGELQILEIADRLNNCKSLKGIRGTCIVSDEIEQGFELMPSHEQVNDDKAEFCKMSVMLTNYKNLAQRCGNRYVLQYKYPDYTTKFLDWIYSLDYSRELNKRSYLKMARFSVVTHRGCIGRCNFCSIALHQGDKIISRSEQSILDEIKRITKLKGFKGYIDDLGGPSANMYGMDCNKCDEHHCMSCKNLDKSHTKLIRLLTKARGIEGIKKIFIRSGIRYDLALNSKEYIEEISKHHISGCLKIAPEHLSENVLKLMNKNNSNLDKFLTLFDSFNTKLNKNQSIRYYFMIGHPGDTIDEIKMMKDKLRKLKNIEQFQLFTPTPMTISSCMYWTGINPLTMEKIDVIYDYNTKKRMKNVFLGFLK